MGCNGKKRESPHLALASLTGQCMLDSTDGENDVQQFQEMTAKADFNFRASAKGRAVVVRAGQKFWMTNTASNAQRTGLVVLERKGKGSIGTGYPFSLEQVANFFQEAA